MAAETLTAGTQSRDWTDDPYRPICPFDGTAMTEHDNTAALVCPLCGTAAVDEARLP
jgi:hypothetical protein